MNAHTYARFNWSSVRWCPRSWVRSVHRLGTCGGCGPCVGEDANGRRGSVTRSRAARARLLPNALHQPLSEPGPSLSPADALARGNRSRRRTSTACLSSLSGAPLSAVQATALRWSRIVRGPQYRALFVQEYSVARRTPKSLAIWPSPLSSSQISATQTTRSRNSLERSFVTVDILPLQPSGVDTQRSPILAELLIGCGRVTRIS